SKMFPVALLLAAGTAHAQPAGAQAETLFRQGKDLMAKGKIAEACAAFDASQKLEPTISALLNLAACREKNGQLATAWGLFLEARGCVPGGRAADPARRRRPDPAPPPARGEPRRQARAAAIDAHDHGAAGEPRRRAADPARRRAARSGRLERGASRRRRYLQD